MEFSWEEIKDGVSDINADDINRLADGIKTLNKEKAEKKEIPKVPSKLSELTNDMNFVQDPNYVHTDNNFSNGYKDKIEKNSEDILGAIGIGNTAISIAQGANQAKSFNNYAEMVKWFNQNPNWGDVNNITIDYTVGQNIMIGTVDVPDLWIASIASASLYDEYIFTTDDAFINDLNASLTSGEFLRVGYITLGVLETQKVDLYELIQTITVDEDDVTTFTFNKDTNGNSFKLDAISLRIECAELPSTSKYWRVGAGSSSEELLYYFKPDSASGTIIMKSERMSNGFWFGVRNRNSQSSLPNCPMYASTSNVGFDYIENIYMSFAEIPLGSVITVCGRRN